MIYPLLMLSDNEKIAMFYGSTLAMSINHYGKDIDKANDFFQYALRECIKLYINDGEKNNHKQFVNDMTHFCDTIKPEFSPKEKRQYA